MGSQNQRRDKGMSDFFKNSKEIARRESGPKHGGIASRPLGNPFAPAPVEREKPSESRGLGNPFATTPMQSEERAPLGNPFQAKPTNGDQDLYERLNLHDYAVPCLICRKPVPMRDVHAPDIPDVDTDLTQENVQAILAASCPHCGFIHHLMGSGDIR